MQPLQEVHCSNSCEQAAAWSDKPLEMRTRPRTTRPLFWLMHEFITSHCTDVFKTRPEKELQCFSSPSSRLLSCHDIPKEQKWVMFLGTDPAFTWSVDHQRYHTHVVWYSSWLTAESAEDFQINWKRKSRLGYFGQNGSIWLCQINKWKTAMETLQPKRPNLFQPCFILFVLLHYLIYFIKYTV